MKIYYCIILSILFVGLSGNTNVDSKETYNQVDSASYYKQKAEMCIKQIKEEAKGKELICL